MTNNEKYPPGVYEIVYDYYGELKLTIPADCMCHAVSVANLCIGSVLGFVPKKLSIREIKEEEK